MYVRIPHNTSHMHQQDVLTHCAERYNGEVEGEISNEAAVTIASWYQSSRGHGATFAALCSHFEVTVEALHSAIAYEYAPIKAAEEGCSPEQSELRAIYVQERLFLDMLATWAVNFGG